MVTDQSRLRELFIAACDLPAPQQIALIDEQCSDDPKLRLELEQLLRQDGSTDGILADAGLTAGLQLDVDTLLEVELPEKIGCYRVKRVLGQGGMGIVYLAQQENPQRDVAVKVIRSGIMNRELIRRFEFEAAVLGRLKHPGIAKILEAGTIDEGSGKKPFFAMEFIEGRSLTEYCRHAAQSVRDRLIMFVQICDAVHHAHQRGVIHRDLKPGNILVTGDGQTHVLDFGVARATEADLQVSTLRTGAGQLIGTFPYMSPEQISGLSQEVDTRSDVYSLGVVLYELLVGETPFDLAQLSVPNAIQKLKDGSPERISRKNKAFRGDIETIVHKSLEKDKRLRYQSASELAADINRYLSNRIIEARPASTWHQFGKFTRRHKGLVSALVAILATLVTAGILVGHFAYQQSIALSEANRQILIKDEINDFLNEDLLGKANPFVVGKSDVTVRTLLDAASGKIGGRFEDMPLVEAAIRLTIGQTYSGLAEYKKSQEQLELARALYVAELGLESRPTIDTTIQLVNSLIFQWKLDEAEVLCLELLTILESKLDSSPDTVARCYELYASVLNPQGRFSEAESYHRKAIEIWDRFNRVAWRGWRNVARHNLANSLKDQKKLDEAESLFRDVVEERNVLFTNDHPLTSTAIHNLATVLYNQAKREDLEADARNLKLDEAEELFNEALSLRRASLGDAHPHTIASLYSIALIKEVRHEFEEAEEIFQQSLELYRKAHGTDEHMDVLNAMNGVGTSQVNLGHPEEAAPLFESAFAICVKMLGPDHFKTGVYLNNFLICHESHSKDEFAVQDFHGQYKDQLSLKNETLVLMVLARILAHHSKFDEAIEIQTGLCERIVDSNLSSRKKAESYYRLAKYLNDDGRNDEAAVATRQAEQFRAKAQTEFTTTN